MQNPQLSGSQPAPMAGELFVLSRDTIHCTVKGVSGCKIDAHGTLFLSTLRMVFVSEKPGSSFDIPLATLKNESFNQPIFWANNMTGVSPPLDQPPECTQEYKWCVEFRNGGVGTFLPFFFRLLHEMRTRLQRDAQPAAASGGVGEPVPQAVAQALVQQAFVDPADPTKFYISEPAR